MLPVKEISSWIVTGDGFLVLVCDVNFFSLKMMVTKKKAIIAAMICSLWFGLLAL